MEQYYPICIKNILFYSSTSHASFFKPWQSPSVSNSQEFWKKNKMRFYVFYSSYTSFSVFHSPLPTAIAHFRLLSNDILDRALGLGFFFTILAEFDRHLLPQFCHFSYLVPHCTVSWLFIILPRSQNTDYKLKIHYHFS